MKDVFLVLAGAVTIGSVVPYIRNIIKGTTKPNIVSWITWTMLTGVATIAEIAAGEYRTAIFTGTAVIETLLIVLLGIKYGHTKYTAFDVVCQAGALFGFVLWAIFNSPAAAVIFAVTIDLVGALPTIRHSWLKPGEETWITYGMAGLGGLLAIFALTEFNWTSLTYAVYVVFINCLLSIILVTRI
ncbi:MAG TPA: hypothetical protein VJJ78_04440 [Candidatus Saccharimonadales bacterium]|nr:hypothetical protein [Candidatus Saccharimonadales bacterium]